MIDKKEFVKNFEAYAMPFELEKLFDFSVKKDAGRFSEGFELSSKGKKAISTWSENPIFLNKLMPFANATGTGSIYCIWDNGETEKVNEMPIAVFGDEGGEHIVAENLLALFQILTFDVEPMIDWDEVYYHKPKDHEPSEKAEAYKKWLKKNFNFESIGNPNKLVEKAQKRYQQSFKEWLSQYINYE